LKAHSTPRSLPFDPVTLADVDALAHALAGEEVELASAVEFARAQLELLRIRSARADLMAKFELHRDNMHELQRLVALDRYERYARTKRRRASHSFDARIGRLGGDVRTLEQLARGGPNAR
jgi:hypothetical protein